MNTQHCPICDSVERQYLFDSHSTAVVKCSGCRLVFRDFSRTKRAHGVQAFAADVLVTAPEDDTTEADFAGRVVAHLKAQFKIDDANESGTHDRSSVNNELDAHVLIVSPVTEPCLERALHEAGFRVSTSRDITRENSIVSFDSVVLPYSLEKYAEPAAVLKACNSALKIGGLLLVSTQTLDSKWVRVFRQQWTGWRPENLYYFRKRTLQLILEQSGFGKIVTAKDRRLYSLDHIATRASRYPATLLTGCASLLNVLPQSLKQNLRVRIPSSGLLVSAHKIGAPSKPKLSIIMPVFNEKSSFAETLQNVLDKELEGIAGREVIIVESNSTDGTRELVRTYENQPGVKVVYEERPRGKGHAVRVGFGHATGDIILIQDADSEYDVEDYDELLKPLIENRELFVLGTRHNGSWKMRSFTDQPQLAVLLNFGQILFTTLMNVLYQQNMTDPFTMYKVFRRECLYGINFECNRFDFDHELVIKLLLKGYEPYEVPVNYCSRSYSEGKKVTFVVDPLLWIRANFKFRVTSPYTSDYERLTTALTRAPAAPLMVAKGVEAAASVSPFNAGCAFNVDQKISANHAVTPDRTVKAERSLKPERVTKADRPDRTYRPDKADRPIGADRTVKADHTVHTDHAVPANNTNQLPQVDRAGDANQTGNVNSRGNTNNAGNVNQPGNTNNAGNVNKPGNTNNAGNVNKTGNTNSAGSANTASDINTAGDINFAVNFDYPVHLDHLGNVDRAGTADHGVSNKYSSSTDQSQSTNVWRG